MSASLPIRDARYMTTRQRTICHLAYIFFSVVLSDFLLQDSAIGMTASEFIADTHFRKIKSHKSAVCGKCSVSKLSELDSEPTSNALIIIKVVRL